MTRLGIPNKGVESTHGKPEHGTLDGRQTNLSIFARYVVNEITIGCSTIQGSAGIL